MATNGTVKIVPLKNIIILFMMILFLVPFILGLMDTTPGRSRSRRPAQSLCLGRTATPKGMATPRGTAMTPRGGRSRRITTSLRLVGTANLREMATLRRMASPRRTASPRAARRTTISRPVKPTHVAICLSRIRGRSLVSLRYAATTRHANVRIFHTTDVIYSVLISSATLPI